MRLLLYWATVCKTLCPMPSDRYLSCLSVMLVYCGQTLGWIKMPLGTEVCLRPGHIVLDGDPAPPMERGTAAPHFSAHVCCGQTAGWIRIPLGACGGRPRPRRHCVRWGPSPSSFPPHKKGYRSPHFLDHVYCGQTVAHVSNCWALVEVYIHNARWLARVVFALCLLTVKIILYKNLCLP